MAVGQYHERLKAALGELQVELTKSSEAAGASIGEVLNGSKKGRSVPELSVFMRGFASDAARLEAVFFRSVNEMAMAAGDGHGAMFTEAKNQASLLVRDASQSTLKVLTNIYDPMIELFSSPHLTALRSMLEELINGMKCRDLAEVCHEREIFDIYHDFCEGLGDAKRASLMKLPRNVSLAMDLVKNAKKDFDVHIFQPRTLAKKNISDMNKNNKNNQDWRPDDREVVRQIERGVELVKSRVQYALANMKRRAGNQGFPRSTFSSELNDYFFCVQEGIFSACKVWGTKYEDDVAVRFEGACGPCNEKAMQLYEEVVDEYIKVAKEELFKLVDTAFSGSEKGGVDMRALDKSLKERGVELMGQWDLTDEQRENLSRAPMQAAYSHASRASALGQGARTTGAFPSSVSSSSSSAAQRKRGRAPSPPSEPSAVETKGASAGAAAGAGSGTKKSRPDSLSQAKRDAQEEVRRRKEGFMQPSSGAASSGGSSSGSKKNSRASRGPAAGRDRAKSPEMEMDEEEEEEEAEPEPEPSPAKRRRKAVAITIDAGPTGGKARAPPVLSSRKRKVGDIGGSKGKSSAGADGETALERSKRESKEALAQRAAEYIANLEARGGAGSSAKGRRKSGRGK